MDKKKELYLLIFGLTLYILFFPLNTLMTIYLWLYKFLEVFVTIFVLIIPAIYVYKNNLNKFLYIYIFLLSIFLNIIFIFLAELYFL
jgi:hypothetical protein